MDFRPSNSESAAVDPRVKSRMALEVVAYVLAYVLLDWVSYVNPIAPLGITPWNPPPGLSVFLLLRRGLKYWPAVLTAAIAADVAVRGVSAGWLALLLSGGVITAGYTGAAYLLRDRLRLRLELDSARDMGGFVIVMAIATLAVATLFSGLHVVLDVIPPEEFGRNLVRYWVGDLDGVLVLAPVLFVHLSPHRPVRPSRTEILEYLAQGLALIAAVWGFEALASQYGMVFFSVLFLPLTWIAARHGIRGATLALASLQLGLIVLIQFEPAIGATFVQLQAAMLMMCVTGLALGAAVSHRVRVERDLRAKQASLDHALRFAAAGETTSALGHELNQPITALANYLGACQLLMRSDDPQASARLEETLARAAAEARRAGDIVHRIREFFRQGITQPRTVGAVQLVEDVVAAARGRAEAAGIEISVAVDDPAIVIHADPMQVETAVQNILNNAIDALVSGPPRARAIEIRIAQAGAVVEISIQDTGPGVNPEIAENMFEPFQSSRAEGMGLGLAITRTLLRANGGDVRADLSRRSGARFTLSIPTQPMGAS